jgi:hypothetical protein
VAVPVVLVLAVWVVLLPFGVVSVKVTLALEEGVPPVVTEAVIETVLGSVKVVAFVEGSLPESERPSRLRWENLKIMES